MEILAITASEIRPPIDEVIEAVYMDAATDTKRRRVDRKRYSERRVVETTETLQLELTLRVAITMSARDVRPYTDGEWSKGVPDMSRNNYS